MRRLRRDFGRRRPRVTFRGLLVLLKLECLRLYGNDQIDVIGPRSVRYLGQECDLLDLAETVAIATEGRCSREILRHCSKEIRELFRAVPPAVPGNPTPQV